MKKSPKKISSELLPRTIEIVPGKLSDFKTAVPGSKSYTNRALLLAALAKGISVIQNPLESDDTDVMLDALTELGVKWEKIGSSIKVWGAAGKFSQPAQIREPKKKNEEKGELFLGNAGTAVRFLTAALSTMPLKTIITGNERMKERPIADLTDALMQLGAVIKTTKGCPPLNIIKPLQGGVANVKGDISSQYLSALLMAAPNASKQTVINVKGRLTSLPYVDMTLDTMEKFGVRVVNKNYARFTVTPQTYKAQTYSVEADASSATYPLAIAALHGISCSITNLPGTSMQADLQFLHILKKMGCTVITTKTSVTVRGPASHKSLKPLGSIDLNQLPDAAMTVAVLCAFTKGTSHLKNIGNLRVKETDRLHALATELKKIGAEVKETKNSLTIIGDPQKLRGSAIETYDDHRMAMCFAVAGTKIPGLKIRNPQCVSKTYPTFWKDLQTWGAKWRPTSQKNIVLAGLRGTGKSHIGKVLAQKLGYDFIDTDTLIEKKEGNKIAEIVKSKGWEYFRNLETKIAKELEKTQATVIATGGGMFLRSTNSRSLKKNGVVALLTAPSNILATRVQNDPNRPPLTTQKTVHAEMEQLWKERKKNYFEAADLTIDVSHQSKNSILDAEDKAQKTVSILKSAGFLD